MALFMAVGVVHEDVEHQAPEKLRLLAGHLGQVQACVGMLIKGWTPDWHFSR